MHKHFTVSVWSFTDALEFGWINPFKFGAFVMGTSCFGGGPKRYLSLKLRRWQWLTVGRCFLQWFQKLLMTQLAAWVLWSVLDNHGRRTTILRNIQQNDFSVCCWVLAGNLSSPVWHACTETSPSFCLYVVKLKLVVLAFWLVSTLFNSTSQRSQRLAQREAV